MHEQPLLEFTVHGTPITQGSKRALPTKRKDGSTKLIVVEDASRQARLATWRAQIGLAALDAMEGEPLGLEGPVEIAVEFRFARPKSHLRKNGELRKGKPLTHIYKPDLDKLLRALKDAMTQVGVWRDDSVVVRYRHVAKRYGDAGVSVALWRWEPNQPSGAPHR